MQACWKVASNMYLAVGSTFRRIYQSNFAVRNNSVGCSIGQTVSLSAVTNHGIFRLFVLYAASIEITFGNFQAGCNSRMMNEKYKLQRTIFAFLLDVASLLISVLLQGLYKTDVSLLKTFRRRVEISQVLSHASAGLINQRRRMDVYEGQASLFTRLGSTISFSEPSAAKRRVKRL